MSGVPAVDEGAQPFTLAALRRALAPTPGRLADTLRELVLVLLTVAISETLRMPETALSAYIILFLSRNERATTIRTAAVATIAVLVAILLTVAAFMASLSEPGLRLLLIAGLTFLTMFVARASPLGPALFPAGFIIAYGLTLGDEVAGLALQPAGVSNTTAAGLPIGAFLPPEEALLHFLLWLGAAVALPAALLILANLLTGRDPAVLLRAALAERLEAAAAVCEGAPAALARLEHLAREGDAGLLKLQALCRPPWPGGPAAIDAVGRLDLAVLAATRLPAALPGTAPACRAAASALRGTAAPPPPPVLEAASPQAQPLAAECAAALAAITASLGPQAPAPPLAPHRPPQLLSPAALRDPDTVYFALKVTLAVMLCYAVQSLTDWPGIHTCVITCFFVPLATLGETLHKAALRIGGCLLGAALGIAAILLVMPLLDDLGDLLLLLAPVTFLAAWIGGGSERIAYAGWQIGLAFYLTVLQGYGPTLDMETARDRVIGIMVGNLVVYAIFASIHPVRTAVVARGGLAEALRQLATLVELGGGPDAPPRRAFARAIATARGALVNAPYESGAPRGGIDAGVVLRVQALLVPVGVLLGLRGEALPEAGRAYHAALAGWLRRCAAWVAGEADGAALAATLPAPTPGDARRDAWHRLLDGDIRQILSHVAPSGR